VHLSPQFVMVLQEGALVRDDTRLSQYGHTCVIWCLMDWCFCFRYKISLAKLCCAYVLVNIVYVIKKINIKIYQRKTHP